MNKYAVIVAGGSGTRMGSSVPKQFLPLLGKPVLWYTLNTFLRSYDDMQVILVLPKEHMKQAENLVSEGEMPRLTFAQGGNTRFHSVFNGLRHVNSSSVVFVHDGVRCLLSTDLIHRCYEAALVAGNAIPGTRCVDSLRIETAGGNEVIERDHVWAIQTPQTFKSELLLEAFKQEYDESFTDEATVVERLGIKINLIEGESQNIKITKPVDMLIAENYLNSLNGQGSRL
jgi:2-C-methyl-D-erythritol 4-phosphate cytidylyltransferase